MSQLGLVWIFDLPISHRRISSVRLDQLVR